MNQLEMSGKVSFLTGQQNISQHLQQNNRFIKNTVAKHNKWYLLFFKLNLFINQL